MVKPRREFTAKYHVYLVRGKDKVSEHDISFSTNESNTSKRAAWAAVLASGRKQ